MEILDVEAIDDLLHSSSVSKGIERTMEHLINELELNSMYIIHMEEGMSTPQIAYDWEEKERKKTIDFPAYVNCLKEGYHFDEQDFFYAERVVKLPENEKEIYKEFQYKSVVEYQVTNHGNVLGYIVFGWKKNKKLDYDEEKNLHILLKLLNDSLSKQFQDELLGINEWQIFQMANAMTKTMFYLIDEDYHIQYLNNYVKEEYPDIRIGDYCYHALCGLDAPCLDCPLRDMDMEDSSHAFRYFPYLQDTFWVNAKKIMMAEKKTGYALTVQKSDVAQVRDQRSMLGRKFIFSLGNVFKDVIAVEIRKDLFYNMLAQSRENNAAYSIHFVLKWLERLHLDDKQKFTEFFDINFLQNDFMKGIDKKEIDFRYRTHKGDYHTMNALVLFEKSISKEPMVYILMTDVEQLRSAQLEEQRKIRDSLLAAKSSAELKGEVLANISHEIRTPMSGIMSMASVAKQVYNQEDKLLECLSNIDSYAEHMMHTMDALLDLVKVDDNAIVIAKQPFQMETFLNRIDMAVRGMTDNIDFEMENGSRYNRIIGDEIRLYQALVMLFKNTVSYVPISGKIRFKVKQIAADNKKVFLRFIIEDNGNGLTEKTKKSIFGIDDHGENDLLDEDCFELTLASKIIRMMGGNIAVATDEKGTKLDFTIPFDIHEEEKNKVAKKKEIVETDSFAGRKILLAEDSEMGQDALRAVLEVVGFEVDTVDTGRKAVIHFISQPAYTYDAILMDVHMPQMDGREATKCIRISGKEDGETVPIIGLMANTYDEDIEESLAAGMQAHMAKPVEVDRLYKLLQKILEDK